jgi:phosphoglycolate phosphatase-like HAD superfamily hydrolase
MNKTQSRALAIIVDLDGTLCNAKHRLHHIEKKLKDWVAFFTAAKDDVPNRWCIELIRAFGRIPGYSILFVTGRGEEDRKLTQDWLDKNIPASIMDASTLFMRPAANNEKDTVVKAKIFAEKIEPFFDVVFAVEDRGSIVKMWRELEVPCLQCDDWEERADPTIHHEIAKYYQEMVR